MQQLGVVQLFGVVAGVEGAGLRVVGVLQVGQRDRRVVQGLGERVALLATCR